MKTILRSFLINFGTLLLVSQIIPSLEISGGVRGLAIGSLAFMAANIVLIPLLKVLLLPLNLLTLGVFAWLSNVLALYLLVNVVPNFKLLPYTFPGATLNGFIIPSMDLSTFQVAMAASFIIGFTAHFLHWLSK